MLAKGGLLRTIVRRATADQDRRSASLGTANERSARTSLESRTGFSQMQWAETRSDSEPESRSAGSGRTKARLPCLKRLPDSSCWLGLKAAIGRGRFVAGRLESVMSACMHFTVSGSQWCVSVREYPLGKEAASWPLLSSRFRAS